MDARRLVAAILDRIPDEILQKLKEVRVIYQHNRQGVELTIAPELLIASWRFIRAVDRTASTLTGTRCPPF